MKTRIAVAVLSLVLGTAVPAYSDSLSAESIFGGATTSSGHDAETKIERMKQAVSERAHEKEARTQQIENWKSETDSAVATAGVRMLQGLGLCVGLLLVGLHFVKKYGAKNSLGVSGRRMKVLERITVGAKSSLVLVELDGRQILVAVGSDNVSQVQIPAQHAEEPEYHDSLEVLCRNDIKASAA